METWFHCAERHLLPEIRRSGLRQHLTSTNPAKPGVGVYVFADLRDAADMAEYLNLADAVVVAVTTDHQDTLMDEDALFLVPDDEQSITGMLSIMPSEAIWEYVDFIKSRGGDDVVAYDDPDVAKFKVGLIDRYNIRPHPDFKVPFGHHDMATCRVIKTPITIDRVMDIEDEESSEPE